MKLAFISNLYPPYIVGGYELLARDVTEALRLRGHTVHVITGRGRDLWSDGFTHGILDLDLDRLDESFLGGRVPTAVDTFKRHVYNPRSHLAVRKALRELRPDLVVVWSLYMASMAPLVAASRSSRPVVIHVADKWLIHGLKDVTPLIRPSSRVGRILAGVARGVVQPLLLHAVRPRHIMAVSEFMGRLHREAGFAANVEANYLGVTIDAFATTTRREPAAHEVRFLFVGSLWEGKGPQVAIKALAKMVARPESPSCHLDIYGKGNAGFVDHLRQLVREHRLEQFVTLRGFVSREDLPDVYRSHDVLVFPSVWDEPFALVPVEAMASGLPVIGTTAGGTPEAITDGETGLLVPPGDVDALAEAMARLAADASLRRRLGDGAAAAARRRWDLTSYVDRLEQRYHALAGVPPSR